MGKIIKSLLIIIAVILAISLIIGSVSNVLILAEDDSEGSIPGIDMAALWSLGGGFEWIYPGSSHNAEGHTLHNIYIADNPFQDAKEIIEYTYNVSPNICVIINNVAAEHIFGNNIMGDIRQHDWGEGNSRGDAISMSISSVNLASVIPDILCGNIRIIMI